jgi:hypothetical protein
MEDRSSGHWKGLCVNSCVLGAFSVEWSPGLVNPALGFWWTETRHTRRALELHKAKHNWGTGTFKQGADVVREEGFVEEWEHRMEGGQPQKLKGQEQVWVQLCRSSAVCKLVSWREPWRTAEREVESEVWNRTSQTLGNRCKTDKGEKKEAWAGAWGLN